MKATLFNQCLDRIRSGDTCGLEPIYNKYYEKMSFSAFTKVKNIEDAKDIASEFLKYILNNAHEIPYINHPSAWIFQSIRNRAVDYIRKDSKTAYLAEYASDAFSKTPDYDLPVLIAEAIEKLTDAEKEIFELHYIYGNKYTEISKMINKPVGTIKRQVYEIKQKLRHLKDYR